MCRYYQLCSLMLHLIRLTIIEQASASSAAINTFAVWDQHHLLKGIFLNQLKAECTMHWAYLSSIFSIAVLLAGAAGVLLSIYSSAVWCRTDNIGLTSITSTRGGTQDSSSSSGLTFGCFERCWHCAVLKFNHWTVPYLGSAMHIVKGLTPAIQRVQHCTTVCHDSWDI